MDRDTKLAENGGPFGIRMLADMLLDYAAARTVEIDPRVETRETWLALNSAASSPSGSGRWPIPGSTC